MTERATRRRAAYALDPSATLERNKRWRSENRKALSEKAKQKRLVKDWTKENPAQRMHHRMRWMAKRRGQECTISESEVADLLRPMICAATGLPLSWDRTEGNAWLPSPDRIDVKTGYVSGNVRIVCWLYNRARGTHDDGVLLKMAKGLIATAAAKGV